MTRVQGICKSCRPFCRLHGSGGRQLQGGVVWPLRICLAASYKREGERVVLFLPAERYFEGIFFLLRGSFCLVFFLEEGFQRVFGGIIMLGCET